MPSHTTDNKPRSKMRMPQLGKHHRRTGRVSEFIARVRIADEAEALQRAYRESLGLLG